MYILNKDNNGYLTPDEFNKYAELAQLEIFQEYFERYNDYSNKLKSGKINDGYADMLKQMDQTINYFSQNIVLSKSIDNATLVPTIIAGSISQVTITYPGGGYPPNTTGSVTISGSGTGASVTYTVDAVGNISSTTIVSGGTGYTSPVLTIDTSALSSSVYSLPDDWYLLNVLYYGQSEVMPVSQQDINYLLRSNLTAPTANYPSYVMHGNSVSIYPSAITGGVTLYYTRYPKIPNWTYVLEQFKNKPNLNFLEIGCWEGRATCWLLENILTDKNSKITVVDTFGGSPEETGMNGLDFDNVLSRFKHNIQEHKDKVIIHQGHSSKILKQFKEEEQYEEEYDDEDLEDWDDIEWEDEEDWELEEEDNWETDQQHD